MSNQSTLAVPTRPVRQPVPSRRRWRSASPLALGTALFLLVFYGVIFVIPFGTSIWLSFQNWDFIVTPKYVGTRNYERALHDSYFWQALRVTLLFSVGEIAIGIGLAVPVAGVLPPVQGGPPRLFLSPLF